MQFGLNHTPPNPRTWTTFQHNKIPIKSSFSIVQAKTGRRQLHQDKWITLTFRLSLQRQTNFYCSQIGVQLQTSEKASTPVILNQSQGAETLSGEFLWFHKGFRCSSVVKTIKPHCIPESTLALLGGGRDYKQKQYRQNHFWCTTYNLVF